MAQRLAYRRRHPYATKSNRIKPVKTPGGKLTVHYIEKKAKGVRCGKSGVILPGIPRLRPTQYSRNLMSRRQKTVNRAYGGSLAASVVRQRIMRAFLVEEQKIVKKVLKMQKSKEKATKA